MTSPRYDAEITTAPNLLRAVPEDRDEANALKRAQYSRLAACGIKGTKTDRNVKVFFLRHYAGMTYRDIGQLVGISGMRAMQLYRWASRKLACRKWHYEFNERGEAL